jgi:type III secretory pathway component EscU
VSLSESALKRLELLMGERGQSRSRVVEDLLEAPVPSVGVPTRERALQLLSESAEAGSVTARVALARLLAAEGNSDAPKTADPFDAAAEQRLRVVRGGG